MARPSPASSRRRRMLSGSRSSSTWPRPALTHGRLDARTHDRPDLLDEIGAGR